MDTKTHNKAVVNGFKFYLQIEKGLSENTIVNYLMDLNEFFEYHMKKVEDFGEEDIIDFFATLQQMGIQNSSIARKRSSLKSFFEYLSDEDEDVIIDFNKIPSIKYKRQFPDVLTIREIFRLLDNIPVDTALGMRNKAIFELMYACGLRVSEAMDMTIHDIYWDERIIRVLGKGDKQRIVPIAEKSLGFIKIYLDADLKMRALRRFEDQKENSDVDLNSVTAAIASRDQADSSRTQAPLLKATDAILIDSTNDNIETVCQRIIDLYENLDK